MRAGLPTTMTPLGTERVTTAPAPTMACAPIVMSGDTTAPPPDRCTSHNNGLRKVLWVHLATRKLIVGKGDIKANKHIIAGAYAIPQLHAAFDGNAVAKDNVVLDQAVRADVAVLPDLCAWQDHNKLPKARARTYRGGLNV